MKCTIALNVNKGAYPAIVEQFGARSIASNALTTVNTRNLSVKTVPPDLAALSGASTFLKGASYVFTNSGPTTPEGLEALGIFEDDDSLDMLVASGANLYKDISDDFFGRKKSSILSPTPNNSSQLIVETSKDARASKSETRTFLNITGADRKRAMKIVEQEFLDDDGSSSLTKKELFDEGMEFLLISALYRGFDISIDNSFDSALVDKAVKKYSKHLKGTGKKLVFASTFRSSDTILRVASADSLVEKMDTTPKGPVTTVDEAHLFLNSVLTQEERTTFNVRKPASLMSKLVVANRVIGIFKEMMPNLEASVMTPQEIKMVYGPTFASKKGFIIDGKIVLNQEKFSSATLFHEFGHYYSRWLSEYRPEAYSTLMENVRSTFSKDIPGYTSLYRSTGLEHSETDIVEEIFVDQLGMAAAKNLEQALGAIDPEDSQAIAKTVDDFALDFLKKMTKNTTIKTLNTGFSLNATVADIFNLGMKHSLAINPTSLISNEQSHIDSLRDFFIEKATARDIYQGLVNKGMIRSIGKDSIILFDDLGNRLNLAGEKDHKAEYKFYAWDTVAHIKSNKEFLKKAEAYLDMNKNFSSARFSTPQKAEEVVDRISRAREGLGLTEDSAFYVKDGIQMDRVTHYLQEQFSDKKEVAEFVLNAMYSEELTKFKAKSGEEDSVDLNNRAFEHTKAFMENVNSSEFKKSYKKQLDKFDFKTSEGTYLHGIAEFFFRALNYSSKIEYNTAVEDRSPMYFAKQIKEAIANDDPQYFIDYFEEHFFNHLRGQEGTVEYKAFKEGFEFLQQTMGDRKLSRGPATRFIELIIDKVIPVIGALRGPITIMPEVKLSSKTMGVAGTIDLLVVDGGGRAYVFDYKTKEVNKRPFWDWSGGTNMKGAMGAYKENAMMKASIQTSIYKLMLMELGIEVGPSSIFYVENILPGGLDSEDFADMIGLGKEQQSSENTAKKGLRYSPQNIIREGVLDVSAELMDHFIKNNRTPKINRDTGAAQDIKNMMIQISAGKDIDMVNNVHDTAVHVYEEAMNKLAGGTASGKRTVVDEVMASMFLSGAMSAGAAGEAKKAQGLTITLPNGIKRVLEAGLNGRDEHIAAIEEVLKGKEIVRSIFGTMSKIFDGQDREKVTQGNSLRSHDKEAGLRALLRGTDVVSHELVKMSSDANYGIDFSDIGMLKNKTTGEVRMIVINSDEENENIDFGSIDRRNIFGKYLTNNGARIAVPTVEWGNSHHNMRLIKAGLTMIQQKQADKNFYVSVVVSNPGLGNGSNVPNIHDVSTILMMTKKMIELMRDSGEVVPASILNALKTPELFESKSYLKNPIESLFDFLSMTSGDYVRMEDLFTGKKGKENKAELKKVLDNYDPNQDSHKLIDALHNFRNTMTSRLKDPEDRINNDLWALTDHVIMHLMGFNYMTSPKNTDFFDNFLFTTSRMSNKYGASFNRKIQESATDIRTNFMEYKNEHNKLIEALAEANGINLGVVGPAAFKSSMKAVFKNLYTTDNKDRGTAFILKHPSQVTKQAEKDYLIYLKKTFQKFGTMSSYSEVIVPDGWMPIMNKSGASKSEDTNPIEAARESVKGYRFNKAMKDKANARPIDEEFSIESTFAGQLPNKNADKDRQFTAGRRYALSLDETGKPSSFAANNPLSDIEDNLENIMDSFVIAALDTFHYKDVSEFGRSLFYTIKRFEDISRGDYGKVIETVSLIQRRVINHQESDANNKLVKGMNSFATTAAIAGTVSQALLETFTNPLVTSANYLGDKLYGVLFKGNREFSAKSYSKAFQLVAMTHGEEKRIIEAIDRTYGIASSDTAALKDIMNKLESNSLFQTKHLMYVNKLMMESWQKITLVAYMLEQGTFYAHSLDKEGNLVYDEKKDKRFHFANKGAAADVILDKKKFYEATKAELAKQRNGLNQDSTEYDKRTLKKAWTTFDANYVKEMIVELYSSLDDTSKSLATYYTYMGFIAKMRTWLFSKIPRYFQSPMSAEENESASRLVRVEDESAEGGYRYEWKGSETEGILYTVWSVTRQLAEHRTEIIEKGTLNEKQKKNLSMLLGDLIIFSVMGAGAAGIFKYALDEETRDDELVKLVYQRWIMATSDVFVLKSILDMTTGTGSMMIGVSVATRFVKSAAETAIIAPQVLINPDVSLEDLYTASNTMLKNAYGPFKSMEVIANLVSED